MPAATPDAPAFTNTVFNIGGTRVETIEKLEFDAEREGEIKTDVKGEPNRQVRGSYKGTASIDVNEYEAGLILAELESSDGGDALGGSLQATIQSNPDGGETHNTTLDLILRRISGTWQKDQENMRTLSFEHAGIATDGSRLMSARAA